MVEEEARPVYAPADTVSSHSSHAGTFRIIGIFKIASHLEYGEKLVLVGGVPELGDWDVKEAWPLTCDTSPPPIINRLT